MAIYIIVGTANGWPLQLRKNLKTEEGLVNGALGTVIGFVNVYEEGLCDQMWPRVLFDEVEGLNQAQCITITPAVYVLFCSVPLVKQISMIPGGQSNVGKRSWHH